MLFRSAIIDASAIRYRELYGFSFPDLDAFYRVSFGRGVDVYYFGVPKQHELPARGYYGGMFFKNGVPMGYIEGLSMFERMEMGFNLYHTFREGETAWLYVKLLKLLREQAGVRCFTIDPYQIGHDNPEAIESGAFWFYYKLGFRPARTELAGLAHAEEHKIASRKDYRTPARILRRLADGILYLGESPEWGDFSIHRWALHSAGARSLKFSRKSTLSRGKQA